MIVPIVEGHAERESIPLFIRRVLSDLGIHHLRVRPGLRVPRDKLIKPDELERKILYARRQIGARAVSVIIDADRDCPRTLGASLLARALPVAAGLPISVVLAKVELEAWFIAGIASLRGIGGIREDAVSPADPEDIGDAKGWLTSRMLPRRTYIPVDDQASFAERFNYVDALTRSRSLRKFIKDIETLAHQL